MTNSRKPIVRMDPEMAKQLPKHVQYKIHELTGTFEVNIQDLRDEARHLTQYERRIDALNKGMQRLLDSFDVKGANRTRLDAALQELKEKKIRALRDLEEKAIEPLMHQRAEEELKKPSDKKLIEKLNAQIQETSAKISRGDIDIGPYQDVLVDYVAQVKKLLHEQAYIPTNEISEALGRAEEYATLSEGRPTLCTVTKFDHPDKVKYPDGTWLIQVEVPQDPLSFTQKQEILATIQTLRQLKGEAPDPHLLPQWYNEMPESEKKIFFETFNKVHSINEITKLVPSISSKLRSIPGVANFSRHTTVLMGTKTDTPISTNVLSRSSHVASRDMHDADLREQITEDNINHVIDNMLAEQAGKLAQLHLNLGHTLDTTSIVVPVLMQTLITPANKLGPDAALLKDRDEAIRRICVQGATELLDMNPERTVKVKVMVDGKPQEIEIKVKLEIIATNHPLNELRYYGAGTGRCAAVKHNTPDSELSTDPNQRDMQRLVRRAAQHMLEYRPNIPNIPNEPNDAKMPEEDFPLLYQLFKQSNDVFPKMVAEIQDKELYLSSLQQLMAAEMSGIPYGSCVSGKDRKGISTIYTDAMRLYFDTYKKLPPPAAAGGKEDRANRENFVKLFAEIYVTRHQHENAAQNAPGSGGVKTPKYYLPDDMLKAVVKLTHNKNIHSQCDRLASNNEVGKIKLKSKVKKMKKFVSKKMNSAAIFLHLSGGKKEAKEHLENQKQSHGSVIPVEQSQAYLEERVHEGEITAKIKAIIDTDKSNATGISKLKDCFKNRKNPSLHTLATICRDRIEHSHKDRPSLELYHTIVDLARNPDSTKGNAVLNNRLGITPGMQVEFGVERQQSHQNSPRRNSSI